MRVVVHGATGAQGGPVARKLADAGHDVRVLVREPGSFESTRATPIVADLADPSSVRAAYADADALFLHLPMVFDEALLERIIQNLVAAIEGAHLRHVVFSTSGPLPPVPIGLPAIDLKVQFVQVLAEADLITTVLRPTMFMESLAAPWSAAAVVHEGRLRYPLPPEVTIAWISNDDVAAYAAAALERGAAAEGLFDVAGPEALDGGGVVASLGRALGREVEWVRITPDEFEEGLRPYLGAHRALGVSDAYRAINAPGADPPPLTPDCGPALAALPIERTTLEHWASDRSRWQVPVKPASS
jgi:NAD(P)H dehydrogenase (quinone)